MPIRCNTSDAPSLVRYVFDGAWTARELIERRRELIRSGELTWESAVLFNLRNTSAFPDLTDLHPILQANPGEHVWPVCRAFIVSTEAQHECARRLQALLGPDTVVNQIFLDEAAAYRWLASLTGAGPGRRTAT